MAAVSFQRFTVEIASGDPSGFGMLMRSQLILPIVTSNAISATGTKATNWHHS